MKINNGHNGYNILFTNTIEQIEDELRKWFESNLACEKVLLIIDDYFADVQKTEINQLTNILRILGLSVSVTRIKAMEANKSIESAEFIWTQLAELQFTRKDVLIALGGGIIGDLTGFCAATYMRGVEFIQMPTTLLAQIDSSIGGKVAVNLPQGKNLVGAFYNPSLVIMHSSYFKTLSNSVLSDGTGELIKYAYLGHGEILDTLNYFENLEGFKSALDENNELFNEMITLSLRIKKALVESDFKENGIRRYLNLGHTIGHAIEKVQNYQISHGHCVANGCLWALRLSGLKNAYFRLRKLMASYEIPILDELKISDIMIFLMRDKKSEKDGVHFVLPKMLSDDIYIDEHLIEDTESRFAKETQLEVLRQCYERHKNLSEEVFLLEILESASIKWIAFGELEELLIQINKE